MVKLANYDRAAFYANANIDTAENILNIGAVRPKEVTNVLFRITDTFDCTVPGIYGSGDVLGLMLEVSADSGVDLHAMNPDTLARANEFARWLILGENEAILTQGEQ